jgi:selenocysteine-specific elongation factor
VRLRALASLGRSLRHNLNVSFHSLAAEAPARLRLLEQDELLPGDEAWAQLRLFRPLALLKGDRFIIRDANETLGGGVIVETQPRRHPRRRAGVIEALERQGSGDPAETVYAAIAAAEPVELRTVVSRVDLSRDHASQAIEALAAQGRITLAGDFAYTAGGFERLRVAMRSAVEAHLNEHPLRTGLSKEELRSQVGLSQRTFAAVLAALVARDDLAEAGASVTTPGWSPRLTPAQQQAADAYVASLRSSPYTPPTDNRPPDDLLAYVVETGAVVDCGSGAVFAREAFDEMTARVVGTLKKQDTVTMAQVRDLLGSSRRYVQPFLEELDRRHVTMRRGDERLLRRTDNG